MRIVECGFLLRRADSLCSLVSFVVEKSSTTKDTEDTTMETLPWRRRFPETSNGAVRIN